MVERVAGPLNSTALSVAKCLGTSENGNAVARRTISCECHAKTDR
jgi:hypothetical protein